MDKNKDGVVTLEEFVIACQEVSRNVRYENIYADNRCAQYKMSHKKKIVTLKNSPSIETYLLLTLCIYFSFLRFKQRS